MPSAQHLTAAALLATGALAIDNGVSRTPPMCAPSPPAAPPSPPQPTAGGPQRRQQGWADDVESTSRRGWNSWNHFGCSVTADVLKTTADAFVELGLTVRP